MLLLAADHPAKGKLTMWKESVGARFKDHHGRVLRA
jgi:hypothetical protein